MTERKHTPGPWRVGYRSLHVVADNAKIGGDTPICDIRGWGYLTGNGHGALGLSVDDAARIQDANARLIAAAPEMLEALQGIIDAYSEPDQQLCCDGRDCGCMGSTVRQLAEHYARAAIAKATGQ